MSGASKTNSISYWSKVHRSHPTFHILEPGDAAHCYLQSLSQAWRCDAAHGCLQSFVPSLEMLHTAVCRALSQAWRCCTRLSTEPCPLWTPLLDRAPFFLRCCCFSSHLPKSLPSPILQSVPQTAHVCLYGAYLWNRAMNWSIVTIYFLPSGDI